jgi:formylglycine-generating enzyme required for sulfatase activity
MKYLDGNMVFVPGGTFTMGCTKEQGGDCYDSEKPAHQVTVSDFYIGKYEVTQKEWRAVMGSSPSNFKNCDNCPVEQVSWADIQEFLTKLNAKTGKVYRLPTEAEWEYAARGGSSSRGYKYSGSSSLAEVAWYDGNSGSKTHPVGQKKANELGLYDMSGNVWEWCADDWHDSYRGAPTNGRAWIDSPRASARVDRGGGWYGDALYCRVSGRLNPAPSGRYSDLGCRLAL